MKMLTRSGLLAAALFVHAACTPLPRPDVANMIARDTGARATAQRPWTVTPGGIGPLRTGMSVAEAHAALGGEFATGDSTGGCAHVALTGLPGRVLAMVVDGRVVRIEVKDRAVATTTGARVGDNEARIYSLYPGRVQVQPHKYTDGHYLIVTPEATADSANRLIFETDGRNVLEYRAGLLPAVAWVEGCG
jgi:hypothetical protein